MPRTSWLYFKTNSIAAIHFRSQQAPAWVPMLASYVVPLFLVISSSEQHPRLSLHSSTQIPPLTFHLIEIKQKVVKITYMAPHFTFAVPLLWHLDHWTPLAGAPHMLVHRAFVSAVVSARKAVIPIFRMIRSLSLGLHSKMFPSFFL